MLVNGELLTLHIHVNGELLTLHIHVNGELLALHIHVNGELLTLYKSTKSWSILYMDNYNTRSSVLLLAVIGRTNLI